jgi:hypothetical protein
MTRAELENKLSNNPRFHQAEPSAAVVIVGAKPTRAVDLSRYSPAEREVIDYLRKDWGRPMTQGEIDFQLDLAKTVLGPDLTG